MSLSEELCCPKCGKPWVAENGDTKSPNAIKSEHGKYTAGFHPECECQAAPPVYWSEAHAKTPREKMNAAALGRVYRIIVEKSIESWAVFAPFGVNRSGCQTSAPAEELLRDARPNTIRLKCVRLGEDESEEFENAWFIFGITQKRARILSNQYDPRGFVYCGPEVSGRIALISEQGTEYLDKFLPDRIAQFFSQMKGYPFFFEFTAPRSWMEGYWQHMKKKHYRKHGLSVRFSTGAKLNGSDGRE